MIKLKLKFISFLLILFFSACNTENKTPNVIIIYADDLGFGDVSAYDQGTLNTPNIDRIANEGIKFTNGHSSSATCSPSRYALLTGSWMCCSSPRARSIQVPPLLSPCLTYAPVVHLGFRGRGLSLSCFL